MLYNHNLMQSSTVRGHSRYPSLPVPLSMLNMYSLPSDSSDGNRQE